MRIERTIHPAGFGAFCTERFIYDGHKIFNMVYDCGSTSREHKDVVRKDFYDYFRDRGVIDLLCISHFDEDHINVIRDLINEGLHIQPGKTSVLLPYLAKSYALFKAEDEQIDNYFALQQALTEHGIRTIVVRPFTGDEQLRNAQEPQEINPEGENQTIISSGTPLRPSKNIPFWLYIPLFTFDKTIYDEVLKALRAADDEYPALTQAEIESIDNGVLTDDIINKFKKVCKTHGLTGRGTNKANMNSMMLLSTPNPIHISFDSYIRRGICANRIYKTCCHCDCCYHKDCLHCLDKSSCLYTGDISLQADLTKNAINAYKPIYFPAGVGLLQIPHHGAFGCYDLQTVIKIDCEAAFVNTDLEVDNSKRPIFYSQIVRDFNSMGKCLYLVLKEPNTILVQENWRY